MKQMIDWIVPTPIPEINQQEQTEKLNGDRLRGPAYFDGDDVTRLLEPDFEDLSAGAAADLSLADQVRHLGWVSLRRQKESSRTSETLPRYFDTNLM